MNLKFHFSWQAQYLVNLCVHFSWHAQHLVNLGFHFSWQAQHLVNLKFPFFALFMARAAFGKPLLSFFVAGTTFGDLKCAILRLRKIWRTFCSSLNLWFLQSRKGKKTLLAAIQGRGRKTTGPPKQVLPILKRTPPLNGFLQRFVFAI